MAGLLFFLIAFLVLIMLPYPVRLAIALLSSIFQIYTFSLFGFYPSIALLSYASLVPTLLSLRSSFFQVPVLLLIGLIGLQIISLAWSPDRHFGFTTILYEIPFLILYLIVFDLAKNNPEKLLFYLKVYAVLSLVPLLFIVVFSISHALNLSYIHSRLAEVLIHPSPLNWYLRGFDGMGWVGKPRGVIFDPNAAGGYLGICSLVFFGLGVYCHSTWLKCIAVLHWLGIFFSSAVAAICLGLLFPLSIASFYLYSENKRIYGVLFRSIFLYLIIGMVVISAFILLISETSRELLDVKLFTRLMLWKYALIAMPGHVLGGLGFGGLESIYANFYSAQPDNPTYRPHNALIAILAQSGIFAASIALAFMASVLFACWKFFNTATNKRERFFVLFLSSAVLWMFLHTMGENWGIVSEIHIQPIVAAAFGLMMGLYYRSRLRISD